MNTDGDQQGTFTRWIQKRQVETSSAEQLSAMTKEFSAILEKLNQTMLGQDEKLGQIARNHDQSVNLLDRQGKSLDDLLAEIKRLNSGTDRLITALEALPKSIRQQMEKLTALEDQLQSDGQTDRALLSSMDTLGRNVGVLARYAETQQANREEFAKGLNQQIQPLVDLGKRQQKFNRITLIFTSIIAIALLAFLAFYVKNIFS
jgi:chromosome segregation ATPase